MKRVRASTLLRKLAESLGLSEETTQAIVRWLKTRAPHEGINAHNTIADAIERGEWRKV